PGLVARLPQVMTPSGGLHVLYRCDQIAGNQKLAQRAEEVDTEDLPRTEDGALYEQKIKEAGIRKENGVYFKIKTLIETRGEGGYVLTAGSPPACHPSGNTYRLISGDLTAIPMIRPEERETLVSRARSFNTYIKITENKKSGGLKPGEDFNQRGNI